MRFQNIAGRLVDLIFGYDFFVSYTWADGSNTLIASMES